MSHKLIRLSAGIEMRVDIPGRLILVDSVSTGQGVDIALVRNGTPAPYIPGRQAGFRLVEDFGGVLLRSALDCEVGIFLSINDVQLGGTAGGDVAVPSGVEITNKLAQSIPVTLTSSSNTTPIPVSLASIRINNTEAQPIPVLFGGTVAPVLGVVTVDNTNAEAIPVLQKPGEVFAVNVSNSDAQALPVVQKAGAVFTVEQATEVDTRPYMAAAVADLAPVAVTDVRAVMVAASAARRGLRIKNAGLSAVAIGGVNVAFATAAVQILPGETWMENEAAPAAWYCVCAVGTSSSLNIQTVT